MIYRSVYPGRGIPWQGLRLAVLLIYDSLCSIIVTMTRPALFGLLSSVCLVLITLDGCGLFLEVATRRSRGTSV